MISPFAIPHAPDVVADLARRLEATRWTDAVTPDWTFGTELGFLGRLMDY